MTVEVHWIGGELPLPPRASDLKAEVEEIIEVLKERPDEWAVVASYPEDTGKAHRRREAILKYSEDVLEVRVQIPDVYARYVGSESEGEKGEEA